MRKESHTGTTSRLLKLPRAALAAGAEAAGGAPRVRVHTEKDTLYAKPMADPNAQTLEVGSADTSVLIERVEEVWRDSITMDVSGERSLKHGAGEGGDIEALDAKTRIFVGLPRAADDDPEETTEAAPEPSTADSAPPATEAARVAEAIARRPDYRVEDLLGEGGMGMVYRATQLSCDRDVAVKILKERSGPPETARAKFLTEATVTADLAHPNVVPVYELGRTESGDLFYAMKRVTGTPWGEVIREKSLVENVEILLRVCDGLAFAHDKGVIHRDLKPDNVMLGDYGEVLLMDWGLAASIRPEGKAERLSRSVTLGGTPAYMAPEMALGRPGDIGPHSDVYLAGAVLYEIITGHPPHRGDGVLQCLQHAARNEMEPTAEKGELVDIALQAMAKEPKDRYPGIKAFQAAIRDYQSHAESIGLSQRAEEELRQASQSKDYADFARALFTYEEALNLWPGNRIALASLVTARLAYANCAFQRGDLDLARTMLVAGDLYKTSLGEKINAARRERMLRRQRTRTARRAIGVLFLLLLAFLAYFVQDWYRQWGQWRRIYEARLDDPEVPATVLDGLRFTDASRSHGVRPEPIAPGEGLSFREAGWAWLRNLRVRSDVRLVMRVRPTTPDSLELVINGRNEPAQGWHLPAGYCVKLDFTGLSARTALMRNSVPDFGARRLRYADLPVDQVHEVLFERVGDTVRLAINGKTLIEDEELLPLQGHGLDRIGFRAWQPTTKILSLEVYRLSLPERASPLMVGDGLVRAGHVHDALRTYRELAEDYRGKPLAEKALAKAYILATRSEARNEALAAAIREEFVATFPDSPLRAGILQIDALRHWRGGQYDEALADAAEALRLDPDSRTAIELLHATSKRIPREALHELLRLLGQSRQLDVLDLADAGLESLEPLAGLRLQRLIVSFNDITSLAPLRGMELQTLNASDNHIDSVAPLRGMPLEKLELADNRIESLDALESMSRLRSLTIPRNRIQSIEPLRGLPLHYLAIDDNDVDSLAPLAGSSLNTLFAKNNRITELDPIRRQSLRALTLTGNRIVDLAPLRAMTSLKTLYLSENRIADVEPLAGLQLEMVSISGNPVTDLSPLVRLPTLRVLDCSAKQLRGTPALERSGITTLTCLGDALETLEPLRGMKLNILFARNNRVASLAPLAGLPLRRLDVTANRIRDLGPIAGSRLRQLDVSQNPIPSLAGVAGLPLHSLGARECGLTSLEPLRGASLVDLFLGENEVEDLAPIQGMPLKRLFLQNNRVASIEPLRNMPLRDLQLEGNRIESIAPLAGMPLTRLYMSRNRVRDLAPLATMPKLWRVVADQNEIESLEPLAHLSISELRVSHNRIRLVAPLVGTPLDHLAIDHNPVEDMNALARIRTLRVLQCDGPQLAAFTELPHSSIEEIRIEDPRLADLEPLRGMQDLRDLRIPGASVADLGPLIGIPLRTADLSDIQAPTLGPLLDAPPRLILFGSRAMTNEEIALAARQWSLSPDHDWAARTARILLALRRGEREDLLREAEVFRGHHYLVVPKRADWEDARALARSVAGHLVTIEDRDERIFLQRLLDEDRYVETFGAPWCGVVATDEGPRMSTGAPATYLADCTATYGVYRGPLRISRDGWLHHYRSGDPPPLFIIEWEPAPEARPVD